MIGAYDNATIVLKSDHGEPVNYYSQGEHALKINNHPLWGYNRYRPTLMIKSAHQTYDKIVRNKAQVVLSDLAYTLCKDAKFQGCDKFEGVDILGDLSPATFRGKKIYLYVPRDPSSDFQIQAHKEIEISRGGPLLEALRDTGDIKVVIAGAEAR
jgi:arylsulfatase A-like enzyme